jgi:hypothetical protein
MKGNTMQTGRKPLESEEEYMNRKIDYLKNLRTTKILISHYTIKLERHAKLLEDEYNLSYPEWSNVLGGLEDIGDKLTKFIEEVIETR